MAANTVHAALPRTGEGEKPQGEGSLQPNLRASLPRTGASGKKDESNRRREPRARRLRGGLVALASLAALLLVVAALMLASSATRAQGTESVRQAVLSAAMQCCAVEGSYPSTLEHLEDHYGLSVNHNDYVILYEAFASNVAPTITVVPR